MPSELPTDAHPYWPARSEWPTVAEVENFVSMTRKKPDVRLAVLTGLRRYGEPGTAQMLVAIGSVIVSIIAVVLGVAALNPLLHLGVAGAGLLYVVLVGYGIGLALEVDERRKAASVWLKALESRIR
ncbi:hypothetical protein GCM10008097_15520 [Mycetocola manganoxydans]|nr:hypothetical protein GCM10008097_15520 [Mycetocola manganoxydans]